MRANFSIFSRICTILNMKWPIFSLVFACVIPLLNGKLTKKYDKTTFLDKTNTNVKFSWKYDVKDDMLFIGLEVKATGWVGFGFAHKIFKMQGYDVIVGRVIPGRPVEFSDRLTVGNREPSLDMQQDYNLTHHEEVNGTTTLEFHRKRQTGDSKDIDIKRGPMWVVYAYHSTADYSSPYQSRHDYQGYKQIVILPDSTPSPPTINNFSSPKPTETPTRPWISSQIKKPKPTTSQIVFAPTSHSIPSSPSSASSSSSIASSALSKSIIEPKPTPSQIVLAPTSHTIPSSPMTSSPPLYSSVSSITSFTPSKTMSPSSASSLAVAPTTSSALSKSSSIEPKPTTSQIVLAPTSNSIPSSPSSASSLTVPPTTSSVLLRSSSIGPSFLPDYDKFIKVSLDVRIVSIDYEVIRDQEGSKYQEFRKDFESSIAKRKMVWKVQIVSLRKGSVIVDYEVLVNTTSQQEVQNVIGDIQKEVTSGKLGKFSVDPSYPMSAVITMKVGSTPESVSSKEDRESVYLLSTIILGCAVCILLISLIIILVCLRKRRYREGSFNLKRLN